MTTHELLELASLDALGLLDEDERAAFERGFQMAPPSLQAQIRREQARLARAEALLPDVEPSASLRARVLACVREAIQTVGTTRSGRFVPPLLPSRGVSPLWRAAAVGSVAAAIVLGLTTLQIQTKVREINGLISANAQEADWVREFGPRFRNMIYDPSTTLVQFDRAADAARDSQDVAGQAVILVDGEGTGLFLSKDLPPSPNGYALVPVNEDGSLGRPILVIDSTAGTKFNDRIPNLEVALAGAKGMAVIAQSRTGLALDNAVLLSKKS